MSPLGLGCAPARVTGSLRVAGTWTAEADGKYWDNTTTTGDQVMTLPASCLDISGTLVTCDVLGPSIQTLGYQSVTCAPAATGGCTCLATVEQVGSMGLVSREPQRTGRFKAAANLVTIDSGATYAYCASADQMTWTPQSGGPAITGTVVLSRSGAPGSGGVAGTGGAGGAAGSTGAGGSTAATRLPCDIYALDGGPCVAAHSTVRALLGTYSGPLYQVRRDDGATRDITVLGPGGFADAALQDSFCDTVACTISVIYDQSGRGNHLTKAPPGGAKMTPGNEADATAVSAVFSGHKVYGVQIVPGVGYRNNNASGTAIGDAPETIYMVADGRVHSGGCCFDYGNAETNNQDNGEGAAEAVYFGSCTLWGKGAGSGPWVMGDLENGLWPGSAAYFEGNPTVSYNYVTAMVKGDEAGANHWTIKVGNAQSGGLQSVFDGPRPSPRYNPMKKEGAIILGTAGDNSNSGLGTFFEGIMTAHYSSDGADTAVQASIVFTYGQ